MPEPTPPRWLTVAQTADLLGCSRSTVQRRVADGSLPVLRLGHLVRIDADALSR